MVGLFWDCGGGSIGSGLLCAVVSSFLPSSLQVQLLHMKKSVQEDCLFWASCSKLPIDLRSPIVFGDWGLCLCGDLDFDLAVSLLRKEFWILFWWAVKFWFLLELFCYKISDNLY